MLKLAWQMLVLRYFHQDCVLINYKLLYVHKSKMHLVLFTILIYNNIIRALFVFKSPVDIICKFFSILRRLEIPCNCIHYDNWYIFNYTAILISYYSNDYYFLLVDSHFNMTYDPHILVTYSNMMMAYWYWAGQFEQNILYTTHWYDNTY